MNSKWWLDTPVASKFSRNPFLLIEGFENPIFAKMGHRSMK